MTAGQAQAITSPTLVRPCGLCQAILRLRRCIIPRHSSQEEIPQPEMPSSHRGYDPPGPNEGDIDMGFFGNLSPEEDDDESRMLLEQLGVVSSCPRSIHHRESPQRSSAVGSNTSAQVWHLTLPCQTQKMDSHGTSHGAVSTKRPDSLYKPHNRYC